MGKRPLKRTNSSRRNFCGRIVDITFAGDCPEREKKSLPYRALMVIRKKLRM
jgi:hypothetical protein